MISSFLCIYFLALKVVIKLNEAIKNIVIANEKIIFNINHNRVIVLPEKAKRTCERNADIEADTSGIRMDFKNSNVILIFLPRRRKDRIKLNPSIITITIA